MKELIIKLTTRVLPLMGITILNSCVMYGSPHADFEAKGIVSNEDDKGIQGIRVVISATPSNPNNTGMPITDTLWTNHSGEYSSRNDWFANENSVKFEFEDVDGPENGGEFQKVEMEVPVFKVKEGDGKWYQGAYEVGANVTMIKK